VAERGRDGDGRQALLRVTVVGVQVLLHHRVQQAPPRGGQPPLVKEDLAQGLGLVQHPGVHGLDQAVAADEIYLQGQDAEEQVAVGGGIGRCTMGHGQDLGSVDSPPAGGGPGKA
jgi:hypothetical protein